MLSFNGPSKGEEYVPEVAILDTLRDYVNERILQDQTVTIEPDTPLLEWGILNSVSTVQLIGFIRERFQVDVPPEQVVGRNFRDLRSITQLLAQLDAQ
ncbi:MAG: acyl carrier protein [Streptosporangiaceae bacterium]|jgi:acyl carrier protein